MNVITWLLIILLGFGTFFTQSSATDSAPELSDRERLTAEARMDTASEMEQLIAADGLVTTEEYEEAVTAYISCMNDHGFEVTTSQDPYVPGLYSYEIKTRDEASPEAEDPQVIIDIISDCSTGTTYLIEAIYSLQITNPEDENHTQLVYACLTDHKLLPSDVTLEQLDTELLQESRDFSFDIRDEQVISCLVNPAQNGVNGNPLVLPQTPESNPSTGRMSRAQMVENVRQNPDSELEARVLADGIVTADEYEIAVDAYLACMSDAGYAMQTSPSQFVPGVYQYLHDDPVTPTANSFEELIMASDECSVGTTKKIEAIYGDQIVNPDDANVMEITISCLESTGVIDEDALTPEELDAQLKRAEPDLPFDIWDEQAMSCLVNPSQNGLRGNPLIEVTPVASPAT